MSGTRSASGLMCSHGSELDTKIPRPKMPKTALPPELRKKMGFAKRANEEDSTIWKPGSGVLAPTGSAPDGTFLKRRSGAPMSQRASALAQQQGVGIGARARITRARIVDSDSGSVKIANENAGNVRRSNREADVQDIKKRCTPSSY